MTDWENPPRLFIPGPVNVLPEVLEQLSRPTLGHRGKEYSQLQGEKRCLSLPGITSFPLRGYYFLN